MIELDNISTLPPKEAIKMETKNALKKIRKELFHLQNKFYADGRYSMLIVLQGLDTSGKDGVIRHAFSGMNPQGVQVTSFKKPSADELKHDFLWRIYPHFPEKGKIRVFNRSYYEDVLVPSVNKSLSGDVLDHRINLINELEHHLLANNTLILKYYLHISADEQVERIEERKTKPHKRWKYTKEDELVPNQWDDFRDAYDTLLNACDHLPWHIIPADKRWFRNYTAAKILAEQLEKLNLKYPNK
ncbi:PPK2 family polyphosphate kinase [Cyclobacterium marinum]|uniref:Polyphosphate:nucleotide phosphotransferase, PPK2 family n=1 Tax=Cyclobacterium marinum (strain ATCC 25205 / DSM 745 / LMG 13164 / NCIMB 1802) TaxID=880070 RepID=G0J1M1_CYCMS|nr:PPK2 family polyphosphate kinase [Cyclobacterium marinum]AEL28230.1 polyphosphate:nucleotide phosphotransferase, PPK2 family [Cyclobacterium marinum DSM 745]